MNAGTVFFLGFSGFHSNFRGQIEATVGYGFLNLEGDFRGDFFLGDLRVNDVGDSRSTLGALSEDTLRGCMNFSNTVGLE